jgi:hypothetical protein
MTSSPTPDFGDDRLEAVADIALPCFYDRPTNALQSQALTRVPLTIELELAGPEVWVGLRQVRVTARAVMPVAAVDEDC